MLSTDTDLTLSRGFDAGNYSAAYDGLPLEEGLAKAIHESELASEDCDASSDAYRAAFLLGYLGSLELDDMGPHADAYLEALDTPHGRRCIELGYVDLRHATDD